MARYDDVSDRHTNWSLTNVGPPVTLSYSISRDWKIRSISGPWDSEALSNGGLRAVCAETLGTSIFQHIAGDHTRMWFEALVLQARQRNKTVVRKYRCDTPLLRRFMAMELVGEEDGTVTLNHRLVRADRPGVFVSVLPALGAAVPVQRCSHCNGLEVDGKWSDPFDQPHSVSVEVVYTVCPSCRQGMDAPMKALAVHG